MLGNARDSWIDSLHFPYLVDLVVQNAPDDVLTAFRATSRHYRRRVDTFLARHLVLDGYATTGAGSACISTLHFDAPLVPFVVDGSQLALGFVCLRRGRTNIRYEPSVHDAMSPFPLEVIKALDLSRTRVLDIRGSVSKAVLEGITIMLPQRLDNLRVYDSGEQEAQDVPRTSVWWSGEAAARLNARRLVVFGSLIPKGGPPTHALHFCPPGVEELVVRLTYGSGPLAGLDSSVRSVPDTLRRATFILLPEDYPVSGMQAAVTHAEAIRSLVDAVIRLGVPVTFVADALQWTIPGLHDVPAEFITTQRYRALIGEEDWALFTTEAGRFHPRPGRMEASHFDNHSSDNNIEFGHTSTSWRSLRL